MSPHKWVFAVAFAAAAYGQGVPAGWKVTKVGHGNCQVAAPAEYAVNAAGGFVRAQDHSVEIILSYQAGTSLRVLSEAGMKAAGVGKVYENTDKRRFYSMAPPESAKPGTTVTSYYVKVAVPGGACQAQISLTAGTSEELAKNIASSIGAAK